MTDHLRNEHAADALTARDDELEWEAMRNVDLGLEPGCVSDAEMEARWATERAAVEAESHRDHLREVADLRALVADLEQMTHDLTYGSAT